MILDFLRNGEGWFFVEHTDEDENEDERDLFIESADAGAGAGADADEDENSGDDSDDSGNWGTKQLSDSDGDDEIIYSKIKPAAPQI